MGLPRFAVVDLETSGFSTRRHRILQLGVVIVDADGHVADEWSTLVRLRWPLSRVGPTEVHGLHRRDLRGAPAIDEVLDQFLERTAGAVFTAHNSRFDGEFIDAAISRSRRLHVERTSPVAVAAAPVASSRPSDESTLGPFGRRLCTLRMSRRLDPDRQLSHRLADVCARYEVALDRPHDALADATATAQVLPHLLRAHGVAEVGDLEPFFDRPPPGGRGDGGRRRRRRRQ